ncbi:CBS domain-containing protein [Mycolicibacterium conceptionense]|uniref:CBS domain-containing protein n=1 Tax=Mycolicibacterium conceptionense TaxID=451644 RepID=A0A0U1DNI4_9MYCO|nr:CBS domain-containing protein [Mycolicibacterium conceptionense]
MGDILGVLLTVLLLAANAFFVAAEFALISARRDRLQALAEQGKRSAVTVIRAGEHLSLMLAGSQLGITICSILLGRVGEPASRICWRSRSRWSACPTPCCTRSRSSSRWPSW